MQIHTQNKNSTVLSESITILKNVVSIVYIYLSETSTVCHTVVLTLSPKFHQCTPRQDYTFFPFT